MGIRSDNKTRAQRSNPIQTLFADKLLFETSMDPAGYEVMFAFLTL